jgi:hypothetical protein
VSFFSDLFEGNFGNLGTDIVDAPSSLANNPSELLQVGAGALTALTLGAAAPAVGGLLAGDAALTGADIGLLGADAAAGAGAADIGAGTLAADVGGTVAADTAATAGTDALAAGAGAGADALAVPTDALAAGGGTDVLGAAPVNDFATPDASSFGSLSDGSAPTPGAPTAAPVVDPSAAAAPGTTPGSSGGITGALTDTLKSPWTKLALAAAPLGVAALTGGGGLPSQLGAAQANAQALASQGSALNPSQNASLTQMRQNAVNAARQALFNQGVQNPEADTRWAQMTANIDSQVTAAAQTMIQQNIQNSLAGDAQLIQIAQLQMQSDQNFSNMLLNATKAFGSVVGLNSGLTLKVA